MEYFKSLTLWIIFLFLLNLILIYSWFLEFNFNSKIYFIGLLNGQLFSFVGSWIGELIKKYKRGKE